ncbi:MAG: hypothetical protein DRR19_17545, partial [Candidatus Parabeggiatoa sp. nov. 1]
MANRLSDKPAAAYAAGYLGKLYEKAKRYPEAERLTRQAIFLTRQYEVPKVLSLPQSKPEQSNRRYFLWKAGQGFVPDMLYLWQWQLGRLRNAQADLAGAIAAYQQAVNNLQSIGLARVRGYRIPPRQSFFNTAESVYYELADLLLQQAARHTNEFQRQPVLLTARDTLELFKAVELENYFQDDCVTKMQAKRQKIEDILTDAHTAVLYPMIFSDRVELLLSFSDGLKQFSVKKPQNLRKTVVDFRRALEKTKKPKYGKKAQSDFRRDVLPKA